jgi:hypothetical protein
VKALSYQTTEQEGKARRILKAYQTMSANRMNWESHWQEIAERIWPNQSRLFNQGWMNRTQGEKRTEHLFDSTAAIGLTRFASILDSLLTPQNTIWHRVKASDPTLNKNREVQVWFEDLNALLFKTRYAPKANFTSQNQLNYKMLGAYGSGCLFIDDLRDLRGRKDGIRYRTMHLAGIYFRENHQGIVDAAYRYYEATARQAFQEWGDKLPDQIKSAARTAPDQVFYFVHSVEPRSDYDYERNDDKGMPYESCYVSVTGQVLLNEGGYDTFPYSISRYEQVPGEVYGRSPAMDVLPSIKTLNEMKKTVLKQGHRTVDPVLLTYDDGIVDSFSMRPGAMNSGGLDAQGRMLVQPLPVGNIAIGKELMDDERMVQNDAFLINLFQILTETPNMTATEVMERTREKGILLAPTIGRQESEYLGPTVEREIDLLMKQGKIAPPPRALVEAKGEYSIIYESPMARAARAEEASGLMRTVETVINVAVQTQNPEPLDHFDWDVITPELSDINGVPARWRNDMEKIQAMRDGRAQQAKESQAVQAAPGAAAMIKSTATAAKLNRE